MAAKETPRCFGIFFHGYGSHGQNLSSIGHHFPFMHSFFPNGVDTFEGGTQGYQWFSLKGPWNFLNPPLDFLEPLMEEGALKTKNSLKKSLPWIEECLLKAGYNYTPSHFHCSQNISKEHEKEDVSLGLPLILGGFSQGASLAYHLGFFHLKSLLTVGFSGFYMLKKNPFFCPKILWCHGDRDEVVSIACQKAGVENFQKFHLDVEGHRFSGGHTIPDSMGKLAKEKILWALNHGFF